MPKRGRQIFKKGTRRIYLGPWLARLGRKPKELADAIGITESYVSELIANKKPNPGIVLLLEISEWLDLTVNDLYNPPPERIALEAVERLRPSQMVTLGRLLDEIKPTRRK